MKLRILICLASGMVLLSSFSNAQTTESTPVGVHNLYEVCKAALVKRYCR
jgi:hypothetical protein